MEHSRPSGHVVQQRTSEKKWSLKNVGGMEKQKQLLTEVLLWPTKVCKNRNLKEDLSTLNFMKAVESSWEEACSFMELVAVGRLFWLRPSPTTLTST